MTTATIFDLYEGDTAAFLDHRAAARVNAALGAIQTLTSVLLHREIDEVDDDPSVNMGLINAVACCAELAHDIVSGLACGHLGASVFPAHSEGADIMREAADRAAALQR